MKMTPFSKNARLVDFYPSVNKITIAIFCAYIMTWFLQAGERVEALGAIRIEFIIGAFLLVTALVYRFSSAREVQTRTNLSVYVITFFLLILLHIITSKVPQYSWDVFVARVLKFSAVAIFISTFIKSPTHFRYFFVAFLGACLYITQESFRAALDGSMVWQNQGIPRLHGDTSLFMHPNSLAGLAMGSLPFIWFLFPKLRSGFAKLGLVALTVTSLGVVMYSGSRTSYLGLLALAFYLFWVSNRKIGYIFMFFIIVGTAVPFIPDDYKARFMTIFTGQEIEGASMDARLEIMRDSWAVFKRFPFGVGVSAFPAVRIEMFGRFQDTHNLYLEVLTNLGVHGLVIFTVLIYQIIKTFRRAQKTLKVQIERLSNLKIDPKKHKGKIAVVQKHLQDLKFVLAASFAGIGYVVIRLALGMFGMDLYEIYWWMAVGLAIAVFNVSMSAQKITDQIESEIMPRRDVSAQAA